MDFINSEIERLVAELERIDVGTEKYDKILKQIKGWNTIKLANEKQALEEEKVNAQIEAGDKKSKLEEEEFNAKLEADKKRLELEEEEVNAKIEADNKKFEADVDHKKRELWVKIGLGVGGIVVMGCLHMIDLEFERTGSITSAIGRKTLDLTHKMCEGFINI